MAPVDDVGLDRVVRDLEVADRISEGLTMAVCCTLDTHSCAAIAPTSTSVHRVAGGEGKPAHKTPSQE